MLIEIAETPLQVHTRKGNTVEFRRGLKLSTVDLASRTRYQRDKFAEGLRLSVRKESTGIYNCHGMTFVNRRGILDEEIDIEKILKDDEYTYIELRSVQPGDVILYYTSSDELEHTGVVVNIPESQFVVPWILSKWGIGGEYIHRYDFCPYNWRKVRYMREGQHDCRSYP